MSWFGDLRKAVFGGAEEGEEKSTADDVSKGASSEGPTAEELRQRRLNRFGTLNQPEPAPATDADMPAPEAVDELSKMTLEEQLKKKQKMAASKPEAPVTRTLSAPTSSTSSQLVTSSQREAVAPTTPQSLQAQSNSPVLPPVALSSTPKSKSANSYLSSTPKSKSAGSGSKHASPSLRGYPLSPQEGKGPTTIPDVVATLEEVKQYWEYLTLASILQVHVGSSGVSQGRSHFLPAMAEDAVQTPMGPVFIRQHLDQVLMERFSVQTDTSPFSYLVACYRRASTATILPLTVGKTTFPQKGEADTQWCEEVLLVLAQRLTSYAGLVLQDNEMMEHSTNSRGKSMDDFYSMLCSDPMISRSCPAGFLKQMVDSLIAQEDDKESFRGVFQEVVDRILKSHPPANQTMAARRTMMEMPVAQANLLALSKLMQVKATAQFVSEHPSFIPNASNGADLERKSMLGPFLAIRLPPDHADFKNIRQRMKMDVDRSISDHQARFQSYANHVAGVFKACVKVNAQTRKRLLEFISRSCKLNTDRRKMQYNNALVAGHGFFINFGSAMLALSQPIIQAKTPKFDSVDVRYCLGSKDDRINFDGMTRLGVLNEVNSEAKHEGEWSFVTECFFLTHEVLNLGFLKVCRYFGQLNRQLQQLQHHLDSLNPDNPFEANMLNQQQLMMDALITETFTLQVHLFDPTVLNSIADFFNWTAKWLSHLVQSKSPLFHLIPEYIVEGFVNFFTFVGRTRPDIIKQATDRLQPLINFMLTFMAGSHALRNPHLRGQFPEVLLLFMPSSDGPFSATLSPSHLFCSDPVVSMKLVPALLELYVEVEFGEDQFYDKFNSRHNINTIMEMLWHVPLHRDIIKQCTFDKDKFSRFTNCLANDCQYLLDEGLEKLGEIRAVQVEMENAEQWQRQRPDVQRQRTADHNHTEDNCAALMQLANSTVHMIQYMTKEIPQPFLEPLFIDRIAHTVDSYIVKLIGPDVQELKVKNREKYNFDPRNLLSEILSIFLHLSKSEEFIQEVAKDERNYKVEIFTKAARVIRRRKIMSERDCTQFETVLTKVAEYHSALEAEEEILGEIPDEYLDGLTYDLMKDPVRLPSQNVLDRNTITRHLMNVPLDPFTRAPLSLDMVEEMPELKKEIEDWVRAQKTARANDVAEAEHKS